MADETIMPPGLEPHFEDMTEEQLRSIIEERLGENTLSEKAPNYADSRLFENVAIYTPALSDGYIKTVERLGAQEADAKKNNTPTKDPFAGFGFGADDLKFINPKSRLCFYPWVLFSGGQGAKTEDAAGTRNWITTPEIRDPRRCRR